MRKIGFIAAFAAVATLSACQRTGEGEYEVERPTVDVGTTTDTLRTPEIGTTTDTVRVLVVGTEQREIERPTVNP